MGDNYLKNNTINIMKGLCMLLVVAGHANCPFKSFIYLFHMPVFFMISGYLFKEDYFSNYKNIYLLLYKKIKRLWLPYVLSNLFFLFLASIISSASTLHSKEYFVKVIKILFFCFEPTLGGASWFLGTLFSVTMLFACISYLIKYLSRRCFIIAHTILAIFFLEFSFYCQHYNSNIKLVILRVLTVYILFFLGYFYNSYVTCNLNKYTLILGCVGIFILFSSQGVWIGIDSNSYPNPLILTILALAGWHFTYIVAVFIEKVPITSHIFSYIGTHTMPVLLFHFMTIFMLESIWPQCPWWSKTLFALLIPLLIAFSSSSIHSQKK